MQVIGHRGVVDPHGPVENTLAAVERAFTEGASGVELDVRLTYDGVAVCVHDRDLHRVAARCLEVSRATLAELRRVQLPGGDLVPTLAEALSAVAGRGTAVLDLKPAGARTRMLLDAVARDLRAFPTVDTVISSADITALGAASQVVPNERRALICDFTARLRSMVRLARDCEVDLHPHVRCVLADLPAAAAAVERGQTLRVWTVNDSNDLGRLCDLGVAAVITDAPAAAVATLGSEMALV